MQRHHGGAEPSVLPSVRPSYFIYIRRHFVLSVVHKQFSTLHQGCTNPERLNTYNGVIFVGPQCASGAQNFEISPRFLKKYVYPCFTGTLKTNLRITIKDVSACKYTPLLFQTEALLMSSCSFIYVLDK